MPPSTEQCPPFDGWLMARVAEGVGYWLQPDSPACALASGDVLVVPGPSEGCLRASQLDPLRLQYFSVQPQQLEGLLTVTEWHQIESGRSQAGAAVRLFHGSDGVGQKFARLACLSHPEQLPLRCALLQLWAAATAGWLAPNQYPTNDGKKLQARFRRLMSLLTRTELCGSSPSELASRINCSERHFRCLFRKEFGVSIQTYQSALRPGYTCQPPEATLRETAPEPCVRRRRQARRFSLPQEKLNLNHGPTKPRKAGDSAGPAIKCDSNAGPGINGAQPG